MDLFTTKMKSMKEIEIHMHSEFDKYFKIDFLLEFFLEFIGTKMQDKMGNSDKTRNKP